MFFFGSCLIEAFVHVTYLSSRGVMIVGYFWIMVWHGTQKENQGIIEKLQDWPLPCSVAGA